LKRLELRAHRVLSRGQPGDCAPALHEIALESGHPGRGTVLIGTKLHVPVAVGRPLLRANPLAFLHDLRQVVDALLRLCGFGFQPLVVLEIVLKRGGIDRPGIEEIVEDELPHLADRLEGKCLDDQSMKGLRQHAEALPDLFSIRPGVVPVLSGMPAQPDSKVAQRPDEAFTGAVPGRRDGFHVACRGTRHDEEDLGDLGVGFRRFEADAAREHKRRIVLVCEFEHHVRRARAPSEVHGSLPRLVFGADLPPHVPVQRAPALLVGRAVEQHVRQVGDERDLYRIEDGRLPAAVVAEEQAARANGQQLVLEVIPLHEPHGLESPHDDGSRWGSSARVSGSDSASVSCSATGVLALT